MQISSIVSRNADSVAIVITTLMTPHAGEWINFSIYCHFFLASLLAVSFTFALVHPVSQFPTLFLLLFMQVPASVCEHVFVWVLCELCVWWEGLLVEEVASHKSQLMSITLIRSSIHPCAQGPIHPLLFKLVDPKSPGHVPTLTHAYRGELSPTQDILHRAPRCTHTNTHTYTPRNRLLFTFDSL